jgi:hypothetical protein
MKSYFGFLALGIMGGLGVYIIYQGFKSNVQEATAEAKLNRNINIIHND